MKVFSLIGIRDGKAETIEGPTVDDFAKCKAAFDAILDNKGVAVEGKGKAKTSVKYSLLLLTEHVRGDVRRRSC